MVGFDNCQQVECSMQGHPCGKAGDAGLAKMVSKWPQTATAFASDLAIGAFLLVRLHLLSVRWSPTPTLLEGIDWLAGAVTYTKRSH